MGTLIGNILHVLDQCICIESNAESRVCWLLEKIKSAFKTIQCLLQDAELKKAKDEKVSEWVSRVESVSMEFEDVMVAYHLHCVNNNQNANDSCTAWLSLVQFYSFGKNADSVHPMILRILSKDNQRRNKDEHIPSENVYSPLLSSKQHVPVGVDKNIDSVHSNILTSSSKDNPWQIMDKHNPPDNVPVGVLPLPPCYSLTRTSNHVNNLLQQITYVLKASKLMVMYLEKVNREVEELVREAERSINLRYVSIRKGINRRLRDQTFVDATSFVGRKDIVKKLASFLKQKEKLKVVSLTGEPGIGKTIVATAIYEEVKRHFDCYAWTCASHKSQVKILRDILISFPESRSIMAPRNLAEMQIAQLKEKISLLLSDKEFLLVVDDLQNSDVWESIKSALPDTSRAGTVLVTSPSIQIPTTFTHQLERLSPDHALQLLRRCALLESDNSDFWPQVEEIAKDIVKKCKGIPLVISLTGGMLSTKREVSEWSKIQQTTTSSLHSTIRCCYADLQPVLKTCFLYSSLFPSKYEISCNRLIRLWMAEGFIEDKESKVAECTLNELIQRKLFQAAKVGADGQIKTCQFIQRMQNFAPIQPKFKGCSFISRGYHLSLQESDEIKTTDNRVSNLKMSKFYSFLGFTGRKDHLHMITTKCTFRLLLVLELQHLPLENFPSAFGDLVLLTYLGLRGTQLKTLPASLKKLHKLETLDVRDTMIRNMRNELQSLKKLRHLLLAGSFNDRVVHFSENIECFQDLQTLAGVKITEAIAKGLKQLSQLKKLSVGMIKELLSVPLLESIVKMEVLLSLTIKCAPGEQISINSHQGLPKYLEKLKVGGYVKDLFLAVSHLKFLRYLYVWDCETTEDPLPSLQHLPNLVSLSLCNAYLGCKISFGKTSFQKLRRLSILHFKNLKNFEEIMPGSLQKLESFTIGYCPKCESFPNGLENLTSLQVLKLTNMPDNCVREVRNFHSSQQLNFSVLVRGTTELSFPRVKRTTLSFPPSLPPYQFDRAYIPNNSLSESSIGTPFKKFIKVDETQLLFGKKVMIKEQWFQRP